ncbi:hypothetical protein OEZ85_000632 [Tetradesmus obliquus]|uniref:SnoaL-like domain-containing protein n=1 Tax=Tetradesmus obliquus TaxID=3088 RepID=A0ABY8UIQ5_TETOB|nr:hypothetical protein OEZ85_000632 [Tetradesmus obliquus]
MQTLAQPIRSVTRLARSSRPGRTTTVRTMAFVNSQQEQLCGQARQFVETWGSVASKGMDAVKKELGDMIADECTFKADGVLYTKDLKGKAAIMQALEREHAKYEHKTYYPVAVAADDTHNIAFVGVAWEYKNVGPLKEGAQPSGNTSRGFSIKQLTFHPRSGKLTESRVNRQMTAEEQQELLAPGAKCQPADVFGDVLPKLGWGAQQASEQNPPVADAEFAERMSSSLKTWVQCWSSDADLDQLNKVLDPALMAYDAYGLHHAADKPQREGHAISMMGRDDARAAIEGLHKKFTDRNKLLSSAVNPDQRVAFDHWKGEAKGKDSSARFEAEGVDMLLFNAEGQITTLVQFDMQDYSKQLRGAAAAAPEGRNV